MLLFDGASSKTAVGMPDDVKHAVFVLSTVQNGSAFRDISPEEIRKAVKALDTYLSSKPDREEAFQKLAPLWGGSIEQKLSNAKELAAAHGAGLPGADAFMGSLIASKSEKSQAALRSR